MTRPSEGSRPKLQSLLDNVAVAADDSQWRLAVLAACGAEEVDRGWRWMESIDGFDEEIVEELSDFVDGLHARGDDEDAWLEQIETLALVEGGLRKLLPLENPPAWTKEALETVEQGLAWASASVDDVIAQRHGARAEDGIRRHGMIAPWASLIERANQAEEQHAEALIAAWCEERVSSVLDDELRRLVVAGNKPWRGQYRDALHARLGERSLMRYGVATGDMLCGDPDPLAVALARPVYRCPTPHLTGGGYLEAYGHERGTWWTGEVLGKDGVLVTDKQPLILDDEVLKGVRATMVYLEAPFLAQLWQQLLRARELAEGELDGDVAKRMVELLAHSLIGGELHRELERIGRRVFEKEDPSEDDEVIARHAYEMRLCLELAALRLDGIWHHLQGIDEALEHHASFIFAIDDIEYHRCVEEYVEGIDDQRLVSATEAIPRDSWWGLREHLAERLPDDALEAALLWAKPEMVGEVTDLWARARRVSAQNIELPAAAAAGETGRTYTLLLEGGLRLKAEFRLSAKTVVLVEDERGALAKEPNAELVWRHEEGEQAITLERIGKHWDSACGESLRREGTRIAVRQGSTIYWAISDWVLSDEQ